MSNELGKLIEGSEFRDAVHVAIIPMQASEMLRPGQRVGIVSEGVAGPSSELLGVVDPFLDDVVPKGAQFWLCLFPNSISDMRHAWVHPAFEDEQSQKYSSLVDSVNDNAKIIEKKANAARWIREQCDPLGMKFEDLVDPRGDLLCGEYIRSWKNEDAQDHWYDIQSEFWEKIEDYLGYPIKECDRGGFSCSC